MNLDIQSLLEQFGSSELEQISNKIGANSAQTKEAVQGALPTILGALSQNASNNNGASNLMSALDRDHDGSVLDDIGGFISNYQNGSGEGILKHALGSNLTQAEQSISAKTNLDHGQTHEVFKMLAPVVMGFLGKQKKQNNLGASDLGVILSQLTSQADKNTSLDLGDVLSMFSGNQQKGTSGIGGMLGKLFGK